MLAHPRRRKESFRRTGRARLRLVLGLPSLRSAHATGMDLGSKPRRARACVDRLRDLESTRIDIFAALVRIWVAVGLRGSGQSDALYHAAFSTWLARDSAVAVRAAIGCARHEDSLPVRS